MIIHRLVRGLWLAGAGSLLMVVAGCGPGLSPTGAVALSPVPAPQARIWFYRDMNPNEPMATPYLRVDGAIAAVSQPGGASYRDVAAGRHQISVESYVNDGNQTKLVDLPPGSQLYAKVVPLDSFVDHPALRMEIVGRPKEVPPVQAEVQAEIDRAEGRSWPMGSIERFAFYDLARKAYCVIVTGERRFYGCFAFKKGVIPPDPV